MIGRVSVNQHNYLKETVLCTSFWEKMVKPPLPVGGPETPLCIVSVERFGLISLQRREIQSGSKVLLHRRHICMRLCGGEINFIKKKYTVHFTVCYTGEDIYYMLKLVEHL